MGRAERQMTVRLWDSEVPERRSSWTLQPHGMYSSVVAARPHARRSLLIAPAIDQPRLGAIGGRLKRPLGAALSAARQPRSGSTWEGEGELSSARAGGRARVSRRRSNKGRDDRPPRDPTRALCRRAAPL